MCKIKTIIYNPRNLAVGYLVLDLEAIAIETHYLSIIFHNKNASFE